MDQRTREAILAVAGEGVLALVEHKLSCYLEPVDHARLHEAVERGATWYRGRDRIFRCDHCGAELALPASASGNFWAEEFLLSIENAGWWGWGARKIVCDVCVKGVREGKIV